MRALTRDSYNALSIYDGYPYLVTRAAPGLYHITLLPSGLPETTLVEATRRQVLVNQLRICLVLAEDNARFFEMDGSTVVSHEPPRGGCLFAGRLWPVLACDVSSQDFLFRETRLATLINSQPDGAIFGDLTKGGRDATAEETTRLLGFQPDGTPRGLRQCVRCSDWKGTCLDPSAQFAGQVMTVHCRCDNHNRCARCRDLLYERRLNANYYDPEDGDIWHVPGFSGFDHRCPGLPSGGHDLVTFLR